MSYKVEKIEKNIATVTITVSKEDFEVAIKKAYEKNKKDISIPGFRKGKAPQSIIENHYGKNVFCQDAMDESFPDAYEKIIEGESFKPVAKPVLSKVEKLSKDEGAVYTVEISLEPEFDLPEYKGVEIDKIDAKVTKEDIKKEIDKEIEKNSRLVVVDEAAKEGDTAVIDYEGFVGEKAFEGGKGENHPLVLGSGSFIPGFEEQLIGKKANDDVDVKVTFPEEYHSKDLSGKEAVFKCKVHEVKRTEKPAYNDDFVKDISEFDTVKDFEADLKDKLTKSNEENAKNMAANDIIEKLIEKTTIDIPSQMIEETKENVKQEFESKISQNGIDPKMYYEIMAKQEGGKTAADFDKMYEEQAIHEIKAELILRAIIEKEKIEATDEEVENEIKTYADLYSQNIDDIKKGGEYITQYFKNIAVNKKLMDFLFENAKQVAKKKAPAKKEEAEDSEK